MCGIGEGVYNERGSRLAVRDSCGAFRVSPFFMLAAEDRVLSGYSPGGMIRESCLTQNAHTEVPRK
jgi:hypothetical protein